MIKEIEKFNIRQPPKGEKDDYDSENSWISDGFPSSVKDGGKGWLKTGEPFNRGKPFRALFPHGRVTSNQECVCLEIDTLVFLYTCFHPLSLGINGSWFEREKWPRVQERDRERGCHAGKNEIGCVHTGANCINSKGGEYMVRYCHISYNISYIWMYVYHIYIYTYIYIYIYSKYSQIWECFRRGRTKTKTSNGIHGNIYTLVYWGAGGVQEGSRKKSRKRKRDFKSYAIQFEFFCVQ